MSVLNLYPALDELLRGDEPLRTLLGLAADAPPETVALRIQQRFTPRDLLPENLPLLTCYALPGKWTDGVYAVPFVFDAYTNGDVPAALAVAKRLEELFHLALPPLSGIETTESVLRSAHEKTSTPPELYAFTSVYTFSLTAE